MEDEEEEDLSYPGHGKRRKLECSNAGGGGRESKARGLKEVGSSKRLYHEYLQQYFDQALDTCSDLKTAVIFDNGKGIREEMSYGVLSRSADYVKGVIDGVVKDESRFIGVKSVLGLLYPPVVIGVLKSSRAFYNVDPATWEDSVGDGVRYLKLRYLICESSWIPFRSGKSCTFKLVKLLDCSIPDSNLNFIVYEIQSNLSPDEIRKRHWSSDSSIAYAIQTSGTTGKKKTVLVPHSCICPNIEDFIKTRWNLTSEDVIFGAAPPTFDPHIVELFTALGAGATILYTTLDVKQNGAVLARVLINNRVTILQITPSVFRRCSQQLCLRSEFTSLRILAFGGEKCPTKEELKEMLGSPYVQQNIVLQNIYGVTEVSCWASVSEIDLSTDDPVTLGEGILETEVCLEEMEDNENEIVISSRSRFCYIIDTMGQHCIGHEALSSNLTDEQYVFKYHTGDIGTRADSFGGIIFEGRKDRIVKRNGIKVSLYFIEQMAMSTGLVSYAECKLEKSKIYLIVKLKAEYDMGQKEHSNLGVLLPVLSTKLDLPLFMYPDAIIALQYIPLNANGKLDFTHIIDSFMLQTGENLTHHDSTLSFTVGKREIIRSLEPVWRSCTWPGVRPIDQILKENFVNVGGDSISAARFAESAFLTLKMFGTESHQIYEQELLKNLMHGSFSSVVDLCLQILSLKSPITVKISSLDFKLYPEFQDCVLHLPNSSYTHKRSSGFEYELLDTVAFINESVFHDVDKMDFKDYGTPRTRFPPRLLNMYDFKLGLCVDASPAVIKSQGFAKQQAIIGCHGGILLCINLSVLRRYPTSSNSNLAIAWKRRLPGRIEASVTISSDALFGYVGCHDTNFYKFGVANGAIICSFTCDAPIRSSCALSDEHNCAVVIDSENGIYCVDSNDLNAMWVQKSYKMLGTVSPVVFRSACYVTTLTKGIIAIDIHTGLEKWSCDPRNYSYTSPTLGYVNDYNKKKTLIISGTLENGKEGLEMRYAKNGRLYWQLKEQSASDQPNITQPMFSECCDKIVSTLSCNSFSQLTVVDTANGNGCNHFEIPNEPIAPGLIYLCNHQGSSDCECVILYKIFNKSQIVFVNLHSKKSCTVQPWFMKNFESFSKPVSINEFILLGGRDNKLHVIKFKSN